MRKPQPNTASQKAWASSLTEEQLKRAIAVTQSTIDEIAQHLQAQQKEA